MARKKRAQKRASRRVSHKKMNLRFSFLDSKDKVKLVINQLLFFIALCLVSLVFYRFMNNLILLNFFSVLAMIFGFIAVGFLIVLLVLLIKRAMQK